MKLILLTACMPFFALRLSEAADIFTPPPPKTDPKAVYQNYKTSAAFLKATRSGEIPELIKSSGYETRSLDGDIGIPVVAILRSEYRAPDPKGALPHYELFCKEAITLLTRYELEGGQNQELATAFQETCEKLSKGDAGPAFKEAFESFARTYSRTIREYLAAKKVSVEQQIAADAEARQQAEMATQKALEEGRQEMAAINAKIASKKAEADMRAAAVREAMATQEKIRSQKLEEILASPSYKIWQMSLQIEEGRGMVKEGQRILDHEDAVERESGVVDLAARRTAGERVVAGKRLVEQAFATYKQLGGMARKPEDVRAGPDPAHEYR